MTDLGEVRILPGYHTGAIGRIVELQARFYADLAGFGRFFEAKVALDLAGFVSRLDHGRNGLWLARLHDEIVGSIAVDGEDLGGQAAHSRWFILDERGRGRSAGRRLLATALDFCDAQGFPETRLWTFRGLDAARGLYEAAGFTLADERPGTQWGEEVMEQHFVRPHP